MADVSPDVQHATNEEGPGADDLRQYRLEIARAARRLVRYPALPRGWEGEVTVLIRLDSTPVAPAVELAASSGQPELDSAALDLIVLAVRSASLPESLRGRPFVLSLPIRYSAQGE